MYYFLKISCVTSMDVFCIVKSNYVNKVAEYISYKTIILTYKQFNKVYIDWLMSIRVLCNNRDFG